VGDTFSWADEIWSGGSVLGEVRGDQKEEARLSRAGGGR